MASRARSYIQVSRLQWRGAFTSVSELTLNSWCYKQTTSPLTRDAMLFTFVPNCSSNASYFNHGVLGPVSTSRFLMYTTIGVSYERRRFSYDEIAISIRCRCTFIYTIRHFHCMHPTGEQQQVHELRLDEGRVRESQRKRCHITLGQVNIFSQLLHFLCFIDERERDDESGKTSWISIDSRTRRSHIKIILS